MAHQRKARPSTPPPLDGAAFVQAPSLAFRSPVPGVPMQPQVIGGRSVAVPPSPGIDDSFAPADTNPRDDSDVHLNRKRKLSAELTNPDMIDGGMAKKKKRIHDSVTEDSRMLAMPGMSEPFVRQGVLRFTDFPGEIRNLIYHFAVAGARQSLVVHRPRMASLRARTRLDRSRPLSSDIKDKQISYKLGPHETSQTNKDVVVPRESFRPFIGLTHVCRQIRNEFRPIFLSKQEFGIDLTHTVEYLHTFYYSAHKDFAMLGEPGTRRVDLPYTGNITIAIGETPTALECSADGIEILPLLDLWANSYKMEAGFGRYSRSGYKPERDREAKDLYRLFGRRVLRERVCAPMNPSWRSVLRGRALASVAVHRRPEPRSIAIIEHVGRNGLPLPVNAIGLATQRRTRVIVVPTRPFIHILFRAEFAESWMTEPVSRLPRSPKSWLEENGFTSMEHFDIKVGVAPPEIDARL